MGVTMPSAWHVLPRFCPLSPVQRYVRCVEECTSHAVHVSKAKYILWQWGLAFADTRQNLGAIGPEELICRTWHQASFASIILLAFSTSLMRDSTN